MKITPTHKPIRRRPHDPSVVDPGDYAAVVGASFIKHERQPMLAFGRYAWNRWSLGRLGCPHPMAAASLNRVINQLGITTMAGLAERAHDIGAFKGLGVTAYWTMLAILREAGFDVEQVHHEPVTYSTLKIRARRAAAKRTPRLRKRRAGPPSDQKDVA